MLTQGRQLERRLFRSVWRTNLHPKWKGKEWSGRNDTVPRPGSRLGAINAHLQHRVPRNGFDEEDDDYDVKTNRHQEEGEKRKALDAANTNIH